MKLKRIMAMVLCFAMVLSTMSFSVFAEETTTVDSAEAFQAALETGKQISLAADITVETAITVPDDVIIDLNDKTLYVNVENSYYNNVTIKNGNIVLGKDDVHVCDGYFLVNEGKTLELNDVNMSSAEGGIKGYAVFHLKTGANLDLINSTLNISDNEYEAGYIVYAGESTATVDVTGTTVYGTNVNGIVHAATVIKDSEFTIADAVEHGINRSAVTIEDSKVTIYGGTGRGITAQHGDLVISGNSVVNISDMGEATIELRENKNLTVAETATVTVDVAVNNTTSGTITGNVTVDGDSSEDDITPAGDITTGYVTADYFNSGKSGVFGQADGVIGTESFVVKLYSGETLVGTAALIDNDKALLNGKSQSITWHILATEEDDDSWWDTDWVTALNVNAIPDKVELWVDGVLVDTGVVELNNVDLFAPVCAAVTDEDGNIQSFIAGTGYLNGVGENVPVYDTSLKTAFADVTADQTIVMLRAGTYAPFFTGKDVTITGAVDGVVFDMGEAQLNMNSASVTFNNVTFNWAAHGWPYHGLQHCGDMVYNNCIINGTVFLYGTSEIFNICTFNVKGDTYNVWTYGAKKVEFNGCTFNSTGKSVLIYSEDANLFNDVAVTDCDFIASASVEGKAAIEMDSSLTSGIKLTIDDATTATGFDSGSVSGNSLWNNKKGNSEEKNNDITVVVNDETVLEPVHIAKTYSVATKDELTAALGNAVDGDTILLTADIDYGTDHLTIENAITLDLGDKTLTTKARNYGLALKNDSCIVTNGKLNHAGTVAAIKVWNAKEISNLEIDVTGTSASGNTIDGIVIQENSAGVDVIKNVNIHSTAGQGVAVGIKTYNCGNATENVIGSMENVSIDAKDTGMSISAPCGTATNCNIKGGTTGIEIWIKGTYSASLDLENCTVEGGQQAVYAHDEFNDNPNTVNTGSITLTADDDTTFASDGVNLNKVYNRITQAQVTLPEAIAHVYVAKVGNGSDESLFETLDAAIDAAADGDTITIITNITTNEQVTIDNKNVVIDINGKIFNGSILVPTGNITIKNGSIVNTDATVSAVEINAGELTLENVSIDSARHAVRIDGAVTATINGGTYRGAIGTGTGTYHAVNVSGDADVTINGGTFTGPKGTTADSGSAVNAQAGATITINGGTFAGGKNDTLAAKGTLTVYGGTFDQNPSKYIADNYVLVENGDTYSVMKNVIETTTDSGVYSDGTGVIAINVWYKEFDNNVATYGMYITGDKTKEVKSSEVTTEDGKYYVLVDEIAAASFDTALTVKPYVVLNNNTVVYGTEITTSVNADKYLGDR